MYRYRTILLGLIFAISPITHAIQSKDEQNQSSQLYEKALVEFDAGNISTSVIHLKNALKLAPNFLAGHILLGRSYLDQGFASLAEKELRLAVQLGADKALIMQYLSESLLQQLKFDQVLKEIYPGDFSKEVNSLILFQRGSSYYQLGKHDEAELEYQDSIKIKADNIDSILGLSTIYLQQQKFEESEAQIKKAIAFDALNPSVWYKKGAFHHALGDLSSAVKFYNKALEISPNHFSAKLALAGTLMDKGDFESAKSSFYDLYDISPENPQVAYFLSTALAKTGQVEEAAKILKEAQSHLLSISDKNINDHGPTLLLAGLVYFDLQEFKKSKNYLLNYVNKFKSDVRGRLILSAIYKNEGSHRKTIEILEPQYRVGVRNFQLSLMLAEAYMAINEYYKASQVLAKALDSDPDNAKLMALSGMNEYLRGRSQYGLDVLKEAFSREKNTTAIGVILVSTLIKQGESEDALLYAKQMSEKFPNNPLVSNLLATAFSENGNEDAAEEIYKRILARAPDFYPASVNLSKLELRTGKFKVAKGRLEELIKRYPKDPYLMVEMARIHVYANEVADAIKLLEKAHLLDKSYVDVGAKLVDLYLRDGRKKKALKVASAVELSNNDDVKSKVVLSRVLLANNNIGKAVTKLKESSLAAGFRSPHLIEIAKLQDRAGDVDGAIYTLDKVLSAYPNNLAALTGRIELQIKRRLYDSALDGIIEFEKVGTSDELQRLKGDLSFSQGKLKEAFKYYQAALEVKNRTDIALRLFRTHLALDQKTDALQFVEKWVEQYPQDSRMREVLAEGYLNSNMIKKAQEHFEEITSKGEASPLAYNNLAIIYLLRNDSRAEEVARRAYELAPNSPSIQDTLGWVLINSGQVEDGLRLLRNAFSRSSSDPVIRYHIAVALEKLGRYGESYSELRRALDSGIPFSEMEQAEALLRKVQSKM